MSGRLGRYVAVVAYLLATAVPVAYGAFGLLLFLTPKQPRVGPPVPSDWGAAAMHASAILLCAAGLLAYSRNQRTAAWVLLAAAFSPLIMVIAISIFFYGL